MRVGFRGNRYFDLVSLGQGHSSHQSQMFELNDMDAELYEAYDQL